MDRERCLAASISFKVNNANVFSALLSDQSDLAQLKKLIRNGFDIDLKKGGAEKRSFYPIIAHLPGELGLKQTFFALNHEICSVKNANS